MNTPIRRLACGCGLVLMACWPVSAADKTDTLVIESPDQKVRIRFELREARGKKSVPYYSVSFRAHELIHQASLGIDLAPAGPLGDLRIINITRNQADTTYPVFPGKSGTARDHYREAVVALEERAEPRRRLDIVLRAYDDGIAFRYRIPQQPALSDLTVTAERSTFAFVDNPRAYVLPVPSFKTHYEFYYRPAPLRNVPADTLIGLPLLLKHPGKVWTAITEANLTDYAGMYLVADKSGVLTSRLSPRWDDPKIKVKAKLPHASPWRVMMIADAPGRLIESNLILNLNEPRALADTSWIKPGKTTFPWWNGYALGDVGFRGGLDTRTMKHYIDFCAESGIPYHTLDGLDDVAWYGGPIGWRGADITKSLPAIDLPELLAYAKKKGVRLRLWLHSEAVKAQMKTAFPIYETWGIEGVMVDFFERDDQEEVRFTREMVALAAQHHLTVTLHNISKPTGLRRTYPNLLSVESVLNAEYNKWGDKNSFGTTPAHQLIVPFTRMLAGPMDFHSGGFRSVRPSEYRPRNAAPMVLGTRCHQLALYVVYENYLPMVADYPAAYRKQPGLDFLTKVPTSWDETRVLNADVGKFIIIARRHGNDWYVGSMAAGGARKLLIPLKFLGPGKFIAEVWTDAPNAAEQPTELVFRRCDVTAADTIDAALAPAGGHVIRLTPAP